MLNRIVISVVMILSLGSLTSNSLARDIHTGVYVPIATLKERSLAPRIPKPKLFRSNPLRRLLIINGSDPYDTIDDEDYITQYYRKINPKKPKDSDEELSDHVRFRLFLARQLAMLKYREVHG